MSILYEVTITGEDATLAIEVSHPTKKLSFCNGEVTALFDRIPNFNGFNVRILNIIPRII